MAHLRFTANLKRFFPQLNECEISGKTLKEIVDNLEIVYPGLKSWLVDEHGSLRKHVNIYISGQFISDRHSLTDSTTDQTEIFIAQALSGG